MRMRVLQVATGMPGWAGTEKYIFDLSPRLAERGHEVTIACQPGSEIARRSTGMGLPMIHLTMRRTHDWGQLPKFTRAIRRRFDVVNIHGYRDYVVPAVAARMAGVPVVVMTRHLPHSFRNRLTAILCSEAIYDGIISVSDFVRGVLLSSGVRSERIFTVKNGIDPRHWCDINAGSFRENLRVGRDSFLVASAGRITWEKGFDTLVCAIGRARRAGVNIQCVIAGPGDKKELEELCSREGLSSSIHLIGFSRDIPMLYAAADVVVVPSVCAESFPYGALEGLASGKPVVASQVGGVPEVVTPKTGILVPPGDVEALASALAGLAREPDQRHALGRAAQARALQFTIDSMVGGVEEVYRNVLTRKQLTPPQHTRKG